MVLGWLVEVKLLAPLLNTMSSACFRNVYSTMIRKVLQIMNKIYFILLPMGAGGTVCFLEIEFISLREFPSSRRDREIPLPILL